MSPTSPNPVQTVAYVLKSFPEPSETFIADEALSVRSQGIRPRILFVRRGNSSVVHPSAQALIDDVELVALGGASRGGALMAFGKLLRRQPLRILRTMVAVARHQDRWCYIQALPAAVWCQRNGISFLHAHFADVNLIYASAISAWTGIPFGVTTHRYDILEDPLEHGAVVKLYRDAALIVTISEFNRRHMQQKYGLPASDIRIVRCGIDLTRFAFAERSPYETGRPFRILNIGRLAAMKAQDVLLKALSLVRKRGVPVHLEIIGDGPLREELSRLTADLSLTDQVTFHGAKTESFVRERLAAADLFVLSSRSEGLPIVCMEALAVGTPVVATGIFGIPELIEDGVSGLLVPPDDAQALADAICAAVADPAGLQRMRVAGRKVVEAQFERAACTRQLGQLWREAVARSEV